MYYHDIATCTLCIYSTINGGEILIGLIWFNWFHPGSSSTHLRSPWLSCDHQTQHPKSQQDLKRTWHTDRHLANVNKHVACGCNVAHVVSDRLTVYTGHLCNAPVPRYGSWIGGHVGRSLGEGTARLDGRSIPGTGLDTGGFHPIF